MPAWPFDSSTAAAAASRREEMQHDKVHFLTKFLGNFWRNDRRNLQCFPYCPKFGDYKRHKQYSSENGTCPSTYCHQPVEILVFRESSTPVKVYGRFREVPGNNEGNRKSDVCSSSSKKSTKPSKSEKQRGSKTLHESDCPVYKEGQVLENEEFQTLAEFYDYSATRVAQNNEYWSMFRFNPNHWKYITKLPKTRAAIVNTEYCFEIVVARMDQVGGASPKLDESQATSTSRITILHVVRSTSFRIANTRSLLRTKSKEDALAFNHYDRRMKMPDAGMQQRLSMSMGAAPYGIQLSPQIGSMALHTMYPPPQAAAHSFRYSLDLGPPRGYMPAPSASAASFPTSYGTTYTGQDGTKRGLDDAIHSGSAQNQDVRRVKQRLVQPEPHQVVTPNAIGSPQFQHFSNQLAKDHGLKHIQSPHVGYPNEYSLLNRNPLQVPTSALGLPAEHTSLYLEAQARSAQAVRITKPYQQGLYENHQNAISQNISMPVGSIYGIPSPQASLRPQTSYKKGESPNKDALPPSKPA